jgi:phenylpropionate dioxygenase-like ring-hydroxylating dioxygenase large terminal subunit
MDSTEYKKFLTQPVDEAISLPFEAYHSKNIYDLELDNLFFGDWVFACSELEIPKPFDYKVITLASESIIVSRLADGSVKVLLNNCRHRGARILSEGTGCAKQFQCPYHNWSYKPSGELKGAPFCGRIQLDKSAHSLRGVKHEIWQGLIFISFNSNVESLKLRYQGIEKYLSAYDIGRLKNFEAGKQEQWSCNWKLAMENAMESYHLFAVHKETLEKSTPTSKSYYVEGGSDWSVTGGEIVESRGGLLDLFSKKSDEHLYHYVLISLPPSFVGILTYDSFGWIQVLPNGESSVQVHSGNLSASNSRTPKAVRDFVEKFFKEDEDICNHMQNSMMSKFAMGGKLVELEQIVVDFRRYIARYTMGADPTHQKTEKVKFFCSQGS